MIKAVVLYHPQSAQLLDLDRSFDCDAVTPFTISCGTTKVLGVDLSEANDFCPTYAAWNSALFEASVILTIWRHAARFVGDDHIAFLHSDTVINRSPQATWSSIHTYLDERPERAVALTAPVNHKPVWRGDLVPDSVPLTPSNDPMRSYQFEYGVDVWDLIQKYDPNLYDWAISTQPRIVYAHQFACSRKTLDALGAHLYEVARKLPLEDCGLWTPHMFERIIGLYLVRLGGEAVHTTAFWHHHTSGKLGPDTLKLYGNRAYRYWLANDAEDEVQYRGLHALEEVWI